MKRAKLIEWSNKEEFKLLFFFFKLFLIWLSWKGIIGVLGEEFEASETKLFPSLSESWKAFNLATATWIMQVSASLLNTLGFEAFSNGRQAWLSGTEGVIMGNYCIGFQLMYYFSMLIIISPFSKLTKFIAVPIGIFLTFLLNIIRVAGLCLIVAYAPDYVFLAHDHLFNILVFGVLLGFYYYLSSTNKK